jgi:hypothetical protein
LNIKRDELRGGYRKLHNEDSYVDSYFAVIRKNINIVACRPVAK